MATKPISDQRFPDQRPTTNDRRSTTTIDDRRQRSTTNEARICAMLRVRIVVLLLLFAAVTVRADFREFKSFPIDPSLEVAIQRAADATLKEYPKLAANDLAITIIDVTRPSTIQRADLRGDTP